MVQHLSHLTPAGSMNGSHFTGGDSQLILHHPSGVQHFSHRDPMGSTNTSHFTGGGGGTHLQHAPAAGSHWKPSLQAKSTPHFPSFIA
jgi:hypothetical protein